MRCDWVLLLEVACLPGARLPVETVEALLRRLAERYPSALHAPDRCAGLKELGVKWSSPRIPKGPDRPAGYVSRDLVFPMLLEPFKVPSRWATVEAPRVLARVEAS